MEDQSIILAEETSYHDPRRIFLHPDRRSGNVLIIGMRTEYQRSLMANMIAQDIANGAGVAVIDTTGHFARQALDIVPHHRSHSAFYMRPSAPGRVIGFNPFRGVVDDDKALVSQRIVELFKDIWGLDYDRTPLLIDLVRSSSRLVLDSDDGTLLSMYALLTNDEYRARLEAKCTDAMTRRIWADFAKLPRRDRRSMVQSVLTRLRAFLSDPVLQNTLGQVNSALDIERVVRDRQIFLADFDGRELGSETARLLSCLIATRLQTALARRKGGWPFYVYIPSVEQVHSGIASRLLHERFEAGGVVAAVNQIDSLDDDHRANLLAAETLAAFRVVPDDTRHLEPRFSIPKPDQALASMSEELFALSGYPYEVTLPGDYEPRRWRQKRAIVKRSQRALGAPRGTVERNIARFIEGF